MERKKVFIYQKIKQNFVIPVFSSNNIDEARIVVESIIEGGAGVVEITHRHANSYEIFKEISEHYSDRIIIGAGSIVDPYTASLYLNAGARFIVGPNFNPEIMKLCNRINVLYIPGCATLTEILNAYQEGAIVVKLFPAREIGGLNFLRNIKAPCPWIECIPTGGVSPDKESLENWYQAGAIAVGMGSKLLKKELVRNKNREELTDIIRIVMNIAKGLKATQK